MKQPVHIFSTAGTKYLSQTTASAKNKYKLHIAWSTTAPDCRCSSVKKSIGKSSIAGCVQFGSEKYRIRKFIILDEVDSSFRREMCEETTIRKKMVGQVPFIIDWLEG